MDARRHQQHRVRIRDNVTLNSGPVIYEVDSVAITVFYTFGAAAGPFTGASQANPLNGRTMAQVAITERARYVFG